jgi:hypothetical protein
MALPGQRRQASPVSILSWRTSALSYAPRVVVADTWLMARTHRLWSVLSLGSYQRVLRVDARRERVWLRERHWWRPVTREVPFGEIDHIAYRFTPFVTELFSSARDGRLTLENGDQIERYTLELVLLSGEVLPLFSFVGEGAVMTGAVGVLLGDEWLDMEGTQDEDSRALVKHLMRLTGLGLGPRAMREVAERLGSRCPRCGQLSTRRAKCLYCGARLESAAAAPAMDGTAPAFTAPASKRLARDRAR